MNGFAFNVCVIGSLAGFVGCADLLCADQIASPRSFHGVMRGRSVRKSHADYESLIDQLALTDEELEKGNEFVPERACYRIPNAAAKLIRAEKAAWPVVMKHLDDARPSIHTREVANPPIVGDWCYKILRDQVVSVPDGYPYSKMSCYDDVDEMFEPSLKDWLLARRDRPLDELRIEVLKHLIDLEEERAAQVTKDKPVIEDAVARLKIHLGALRNKVAKRHQK